jgi:solute carrier family 25 citrate transporter 1
MVSMGALENRQGTNQAANFTAYTELKAALQRWQPDYSNSQLPALESASTLRLEHILGNDHDTGDSGLTRLSTGLLEAGLDGVAPGQAVTFTVYEFLKGKLEGSNWAFVGGKFEE